MCLPPCCFHLKESSTEYPVGIKNSLPVGSMSVKYMTASVKVLKCKIHPEKQSYQDAPAASLRAPPSDPLQALLINHKHHLSNSSTSRSQM